MGLHLFDDYAFSQGGKLSFGQVQRMRIKGSNRGYVDYRLPISFEEANSKNLLVTLQIYASQPDNPRILLHDASLNEIKAQCIIAQVNLSFDGDNQIYHIPESEFENCKVVQQGKNTSTNLRRDQSAPFDGTVRMVTDPEENLSGLRRSSRKRTIIQHLST